MTKELVVDTPTTGPGFRSNYAASPFVNTFKLALRWGNCEINYSSVPTGNNDRHLQCAEIHREWLFLCIADLPAGADAKTLVGGELTRLYNQYCDMTKNLVVGLMPYLVCRETDGHTFELDASFLQYVFFELQDFFLKGAAKETLQFFSYTLATDYACMLRSPRYATLIRIANNKQVMGDALLDKAKRVLSYEQYRDWKPWRS